VARSWVHLPVRHSAQSSWSTRCAGSRNGGPSRLSHLVGIPPSAGPKPAFWVGPRRRALARAPTARAAAGRRAPRLSATSRPSALQAQITGLLRQAAERITRPSSAFLSPGIHDRVFWLVVIGTRSEAPISSRYDPFRSTRDRRCRTASPPFGDEAQWRAEGRYFSPNARRAQALEFPHSHAAGWRR